MKTEQINVRLNIDLINAYKRKAQKMNIKYTDVVRLALSKYYEEYIKNDRK